MNETVFDVLMQNEVVNNATKAIEVIMQTTKDVESLKVCIVRASEEISEEIFDDAIDYNSSFNIFIKVLEYEIGVEGNTSFEDGAQHFELYDNENEFEFIIASIEEFSRLSSNFYDLLDDLNIV